MKLLSALSQRSYRLELTVFVCGAVTMIFELVGSRVLGPYVGTSLYVWTSLIGIVLGSLSVGYYIGGKVSDKQASLKGLSLLLFAAAVFLGVMTFIKDPFLFSLQQHSHSIRVNAIVAGLLLFLPSSIILGMVSPYAVKLKLRELTHSGATVGNLYAISTAGSIIGTFLAGFYLIPQLGTNKVLISLVLVLVLNSFLLALKQQWIAKLLIAVLALSGLPAGHIPQSAAANNVLLDTDTAYNRVWIRDFERSSDRAPLRMMQINSEDHSMIFLDRDDLANEYAKYYDLVRHFNPSFKKSLMLGGAAYSYPQSYLKRYPNATMDVVEIDPTLTKLAKTYFNLKDDPRLTIHHEDGRVFLNTTTEKYDVIFGDAFTSYYSVPYQLTTLEAVQKTADALADNGVVILNTISAIEGDHALFLRAEYATYKKVFPQVYLFPVDHPQDGNVVQNVILVALKSPIAPAFESKDALLNTYLTHRWERPIEADLPVLTDDLAPVDYYMNKAL